MIEQALRQSLPYINAHRGKLFVIFIDGETIQSERLKQHIDDITLLNSLGVKLLWYLVGVIKLTQTLKKMQLLLTVIALLIYKPCKK